MFGPEGFGTAAGIMLGLAALYFAAVFINMAWLWLFNED